jgi:hypothetical protein
MRNAMFVPIGASNHSSGYNAIELSVETPTTDVSRDFTEKGREKKRTSIRIKEKYPGCWISTDMLMKFGMEDQSNSDMFADWTYSTDRTNLATDKPQAF